MSVVFYDDIVSATLSKSPYLIVFLSGCAALIYEISWSRQIGLLFGHTAQAAAIVLATYFAGMGVGYLLGAWKAPRYPPLIALGLAEFLAAGWACLIPTLLRFSEAAGVAPWLNSSSLSVQMTSRAVFCFFLLLPATIALGVTLPIITELFSSWERRQFDRRSTDRVPFAYAVNTVGGLVGIASGTFLLLPLAGVCASGFLAAGLSTVSGILACTLAVFSRHRHRAEMSPGVTASHGLAPNSAPSPSGLTGGVAIKAMNANPHGTEQGIWFAVAALSGFGIMSLEVLYTRLFSLVCHNSTYTFGAVIAIFLGALACGAAIAGRLQHCRRISGLAGRAAGLGALSTIVSLVVFAQVTGLEYVSYGHSFASYMSGFLLLLTLVIALPISCFGMLLPFAWKAFGSGESASCVVGRLTAANSVCSAMGALISGFAILPWLGLSQSFAFVASLFLALSLVLLWRDGQRRLTVSVGGMFTVLVIWTLCNSLESRSERNQPQERMVRRWQSPYGWIDVVQNRETGSYRVRQNLHYRFGQTATAIRESRQAHVPLLLHERPRDVLVMGLGTGLTASGILSHANVENIVVAELIPEVVEAARLLGDFNGGIVDNPKVEVRVDDARHYLLGCDRNFDVIISDLFVPWESESGYLYTVEHYQTARQHLKAGGLFCQWIPVYQLSEREFELIADSFASVFPKTTVWWGNINADRPVVALMGTDSDLEIDTAALSERLSSVVKKSTGPDEYLDTPQMFHTLCLGDWTPRHNDYLNTDELPRVEFLAPVSHRNDCLLQGSTFLSYFDNVFARLPYHNARFYYPVGQESPAPAQIHAGHRFVLFGQ